MTEQIGSAAIAMMQAAALQMEPAKAPAKGEGENSFRKLLDQKSQPAKPDGAAKEQPKEEKPDAPEQQEGPVQEDAQTTAKRLAQLGLVAVQPDAVVTLQEEPTAPVEEVQEQPLQAVSLEELPEGETLTEEFTQDGPVLTAEAPKSGQADGEAQVQPEAQPRQQAEAQPEEAVQEVQPRQTQRQQAPEQEQVRETAPVREVRTEAGEEPELKAEVKDAQQAAQPVFQHVEAAPVKVGEVYRPQQTQQAEEPNVAEQIDVQLSQAMERGESFVRIQLDPEALGQVTVEISQSADGALHVALTARSGETRDLLQRHSADLQGLLSSRGQQNVQVEVQRQQETQQGQDRHPYDGHNGQAQDQGERQQHQRRQEHSSQDFIQQLRLGLIPTQTEED